MEYCTFLYNRVIKSEAIPKIATSFQDLVARGILSQEQADDAIQASLQCANLDLYARQRTREGLSAGNNYEDRLQDWLEQNCSSFNI